MSSDPPQATNAAVGVKCERKCARYSDEENELILATHEAHRDKTWARQAVLYNEAAAKRGLRAAMTMNFFLSKCRQFHVEQEFASDRGEAFGPASRRRWSAAEDRALREWNHKRSGHAEYEVFVKRMREEVDPSYFRSFVSVTGRMRTLTGRKAGEGNASDAGGDDDGESVVGERKRQRVEARDISTQTDADSGGGDPIGDNSRASPDVVPVPISVPTGIRKVVEDKLRCMQSLLRASDAALIGQEPPPVAAGLIILHKSVLKMVDDALGVFASPNDRDDASAKPQTEKATPEKQHIRLLLARSQQDQAALKQQIAALQAEWISSSSEVTKLKTALKKSQAEQATQAVRITELISHNQRLRSDVDALRQTRASPRMPEQSAETTKDTTAVDLEVDPEPERENRPGSQSASKVPSLLFRGLSDVLLERGQAPLTARQHQLADMLSQVDSFDLC